MLWRNPLPSSLALLILMLGIGANTTIFSLIDCVLLAPLPFPQADRLLLVSDTSPRRAISRFPSSPANFNDWRRANRSFATLDAFASDRFSLTSGTRPIAVPGALVTGEFFRTLGIEPFAGRFLLPADDRPGAEPVAVLGFDAWHSYFGGDPALVGKRIRIDGVVRTLVGIAGPGIGFPGKANLWLPLALDYLKAGRGGHYLSVLGRLRPGVALPQAQADLSAVAAGLARQYPEKDSGWGVVLEPLQESMVTGIKPALLLLEGAVWVVLIIACANVASLLLARMGSRRREIAVRAALGAGRRRLIRQVVAESVVLFAMGGALGLLLAWFATYQLALLLGDAMPRGETLGVDGHVLLYSLAISLTTGVVVGGVAALGAVDGRLNLTLKAGERMAAGGMRGKLLRHGLVIGEVALAMALLAVAGLLLRSFGLLQSVRPGFASKGVVTAVLALPGARYPHESEQAQFAERMLERVRALPGVESAATVYPLPLSGSSLGLTFGVAGRPQSAAGDMPAASIVTVTPDYFRTMRIPLLVGRAFSARDRLGSPPVAIVNRTLAKRNWPGETPVGRRITFGAPGDPKAKWLTVVGVVGDVRAGALRQALDPQVYWPQLQKPSAEMALVVRAGGPSGGLAKTLRQVMLSLDPELPLDHVRTLDAVVASSLSGDRDPALLIGAFGAFALVLAAVGIFGLVSYSVVQRRREIGIRLALGADRGDVLVMLLGEAMGSAAVGLALGLVLSWAAGRWVAGRLYGVGAADPGTMVAAAVVLAIVALGANWLPARRATRADPLTSLRAE
jgi:putative ABC transport system permease protein